MCWFCYIPTTLFLIAWSSLSFLQSTICTLYSMVLLKLDVLVPYTCQNKSDTDNSWTLSKCWALLGYFPDVLNTSWTHATVFLLFFIYFTGLSYMFGYDLVKATQFKIVLLDVTFFVCAHMYSCISHTMHITNLTCCTIPISILVSMLYILYFALK